MPVKRARIYGRAGVSESDLLRRLVNVTRIPWRWCAVILLLTPLLSIGCSRVRPPPISGTTGNSQLPVTAGAEAVPSLAPW